MTDRTGRTDRTGGGRPAFTLFECLAALAALGVAMVVAAQVTTFVLAERVRLEARLEAGFAADNVLEAARAADWAELTPAWAARQALPSHLAGRVPGGKLVATVDPEPGRPGVKRVTVTVTWTDPGGRPAKPVALTALFASRTRVEP